MKFWVLDYHNDDSPSGSVRAFFASKRQAVALALALDRDPPEGYFRGEPYRIDVPAKRRELLDWLNSNASIR